jgi:hypothetical protein
MLVNINPVIRVARNKRHDPPAGSKAKKRYIKEHFQEYFLVRSGWNIYKTLQQLVYYE